MRVCVSLVLVSLAWSVEAGGRDPNHRLFFPSAPSDSDDDGDGFREYPSQRNRAPPPPIQPILRMPECRDLFRCVHQIPSTVIYFPDGHQETSRSPPEYFVIVPDLRSWTYLCDMPGTDLLRTLSSNKRWTAKTRRDGRRNMSGRVFHLVQRLATGTPIEALEKYVAYMNSYEVPMINPHGDRTHLDYVNEGVFGDFVNVDTLTELFEDRNAESLEVGITDLKLRQWRTRQVVILSSIVRSHYACDCDRRFPPVLPPLRQNEQWLGESLLRTVENAASVSGTHARLDLSSASSSPPVGPWSGGLFSLAARRRAHPYVPYFGLVEPLPPKWKLPAAQVEDMVARLRNDNRNTPAVLYDERRGHVPRAGGSRATEAAAAAVPSLSQYDEWTGYEKRPGLPTESPWPSPTSSEVGAYGDDESSDWETESMIIEARRLGSGDVRSPSDLNALGNDDSFSESSDLMDAVADELRLANAAELENLVTGVSSCPDNSDTERKKRTTSVLPSKCREIIKSCHRTCLARN